jgi:hypothetical protein
LTAKGCVRFEVGMNAITPTLLTVLIGAARSPDADLIRRTAEEVARRPEFRLEPKSDNSALVRYLLEKLGELFGYLGALWHLSPVVACILVIVVLSIVVAILVRIALTIRQGWVGQSPAGNMAAHKRRQLDPTKWERDAEQAAQQGDYIGAVRLLFRAAVIRLEQRAGRVARPGTTNREYLARYRASDAIDALRQFVEVIDAKWYGYGVCDADDFQRCRQAHALIRGVAGAST